MSRFIQSLEPRTLLSVTTSASLGADLSAITTSGGAVTADMTGLQTATKADNKVIATDLKGASKTVLLDAKTFQKDEAALLKRIKTDESALAKSVVASAKGAADGNAVLADRTNLSLIAKMQAQINVLGTVAATPDGKLATDSVDAGVDADLTALTAADSSSSALATADATAKTHLDSQIAKLLTDAGTLTNNVATIKNDLTTLLPSPTTSPSLVGDYKGTIKTKGVVFGLGSQKLSLELDVVSQTIDSLSGTITISNNSASGTITVVELTDGKVTFKVDNTDMTVSLAGILNIQTTASGLPPGSVISGSGSVQVQGFKASGSFTITKTS